MENSCAVSGFSHQKTSGLTNSAIPNTINTAHRTKITMFTKFTSLLSMLCQADCPRDFRKNFGSV